MEWRTGERRNFKLENKLCTRTFLRIISIRIRIRDSHKEFNLEDGVGEICCGCGLLRWFCYFLLEVGVDALVFSLKGMGMCGYWSKSGSVDTKALLVFVHMCEK